MSIWKTNPSGRTMKSPATCRKSRCTSWSSFEKFHVLSISAEGTYHRVYDHCIPKWINQAGGHDEFVRLEDVGIHGNMHEMFLDKNSDEVIKFIDDWMRKNVK